jgi:hypothetical protein
VLPNITVNLRSVTREQEPDLPIPHPSTKASPGSTN